ncbi:uncharacterized protein LOC133516111 isoform X2 [Cydia pomonella]|uniref:uncharacterized protein LOC133516111 isoform X2 n=1 Tax=Cydia pomonella TaxID=82600 RepID=UPI002ADD657D|nr:uncharacterized protein LOC133516111 isoform X2 [Cydia pomonella]
MPGTRSRVKPVSAAEPSASDEASLLEIHLQRQLEEDIASDVYTECNIRNQEKEILAYLNETFKVIKVVPKNKEDSEDAEIFLTPKCLSPYIEKGQKTISSSPSTELTKEYYALVPIDGNLLEKELIEQDVLSNAFHSIIKTQSDNLKRAKSSQCSKKPTSLSLSSSHTSKTVKHSNSCDILFKCHGKDNVGSEVIRGNDIVYNGAVSVSFSSQTGPTPADDKGTEPAYSPDSLITDEPSSSSDYLSAAYAFSPGASSSAALPPLNVGDNITKMENIFTSSDSGLENTGLMESLTSHKDVTLTDLSLTESTLHDLTIDDTHYSTSSPLIDNHPSHRVKAVSAGNASSVSTHSLPETNGQKINQSNKHRDAGCCKSSKEEKQRQNEEIFIMESSSLSSETGSWESVFPPKLAERELCERFLKKERQHTFADDVKEDLCPSLVQKSPFKSTSCFIDAASLADEEDDTIKIQVHPIEPATILNSHILPTPSQPVPCATSKHDMSPNDWSESNDNEDSLEQPENKDPESAHKDLSPTIFEMTPITEDSLCVNDETALRDQPAAESITATVNEDTSHQPQDTNTSLSSTIFVTSTPHNSIMSLNVCTVKQYNSEESRIDSSTSGYESLGNMKKLQKFNESSPIVSGGASIEDYLPLSSSHSDSPMPRRRLDNIPIVSGAYVPPLEEDNYRKSPKPSSFASAWVVDMSMSPKSDGERSTSNSQFIAKKPCDRACESLKNECISINDNLNKSRSSLDSDSSEKSSHKFYIDLSSLPDPLPPKSDHEVESSSEKKNIFSMYIDLGEKSTLKEMPARLSCSLNSKKHTTTDVKPKSVATKVLKGCTDNYVSPAPNNKDSNSPGTFEKYESLCNDLNISISEIIRCPATETKINATEINNSITPDPVKKERPSRVSGVDKSSFQRDLVIHEEPTGIDQSGDLFVKLSDLDKPAPKSDATIITTMYEESVSNVRMTRSIPDNNWGNQSGSLSRPIDIISSFHSENALSLNRLFPHLKNEFSKSMPGSLPSKGRGRASGRETDEPASDVSELSSVQSSVCRSIVENSTTEETTSQTSSLIGFCQSRLGQDLLRMFLEEITPDVIVEVSGRRIKAHKCILSSRCQYFARILSGGWVESAGNVIVLPPFSYNVVHFALCHIYSGVSRIPDAISIVELATLADMLGLEGLKEAIMFTLKAKYCHHFHRPCAVCTAGVLECFPLSSVYSLDDLYRKCLKWITKYFSKVWPTKAFATLPKELLDKCYQQHIINLTTENLVDTVFGCAITVESLQNSRWAECVARMCRRLVNAAAHFAALRLVAVLRGVRAAAPASAPPAASQALHDCIAAAIEWAPSDETARAYAYLSALPANADAAAAAQRSRPDLIADGARHPPPPPAGDLLFAHAASWRLQCEGALVRAAPRAVLTQAFKELPPELRKRLRELGCIMYGPQVVPAASPLHDRKSRSAYHTRPVRGPTAVATRSLDIDHVRESFVPYAPRPSAHLGSVDTLKSNGDLRDRKPIKVMPPKIRTTKAQEERAKYNMAKTNQSQDRLPSRGGRPVQLFENTKPRYLEPRMYKESEKKSPATKKLVNKMISSSESSRNSSPIQARVVRASRVRSREQALSQDSLASASRPRTAEPSTDSLSESQNSNKYATYTKRKYTTKGSVESIQSSKFQNALNNKIKTKIPVYLNQSGKSPQATKQSQPSNNIEPMRRVNQLNKTIVAGNTQRRALVDRKVPCSLMNATKSSQAKMVTKTAKEKQTKPNTRSIRAAGKHASRQEQHEQAADIPVMQRSGTFLKDEPTFGDITTNIDVDQ